MAVSRRDFLRLGAVAFISPVVGRLADVVGPGAQGGVIYDSGVFYFGDFSACVVTSVRRSTMIMDNLGLTVNVGDAYRGMAENLGGEVAALSDGQRQEAIINSVLEVMDGYC